MYNMYVHLYVVSTVLAMVHVREACKPFTGMRTEWRAFCVQ